MRHILQKAFFKHDLVKILYKFQKLFHMWLQNSVLTVHNVKGSHGGFVVQGKHENLVGVGQVFGRAGREDGDSKTAGYRLADGLQIVHAGYNVQGRSWDISFFQIAVNFLFGSRTGFAHNKGFS